MIEETDFEESHYLFTKRYKNTKRLDGKDKLKMDKTPLGLLLNTSYKNNHKLEPDPSKLGMWGNCSYFDRGRNKVRQLE